MQGPNMFQDTTSGQGLLKESYPTNDVQSAYPSLNPLMAALKKRRQSLANTELGMERDFEPQEPSGLL